MAAAAAAATCWLWMCGHVWLGSPGEEGVGVALMMMMMMLASERTAGRFLNAANHRRKPTALPLAR